MKTSVIVLVLLALTLCAPAMAQTPTPASAPAVTTLAPLPASTTEFLATLSVSPSSDLAPAPLFLATTSCSSSADCPANQLCCPACGQPDCGTRCTKPLNGHCPLYP